MAQARNTNVGRRFMGSPIAKSGTSPRSLGTSAQNQTRDSGGGILNLEPNQMKSQNTLKAASSVPVTGPSAGRMQEGYPGMNVAAVNTPVNAIGGGKVNKKVAGIQKFYGR